MVATVGTSPTLTLAEFLALPDTKPASEYSRGTVIQKPMPQGKHSRLQTRLAQAINHIAEEKKIALALSELRCTFGGRSIVPDVAVLHWGNLPKDEDGEIADRVERSPDWIIEIVSPNQSTTLVMEKIIFCLHHGTELGWLIDPHAKSITVLHSGLPMMFFADSDEPLIALKALPDWQLSAQAVFNWLKV
jgi:Uma2 family endonuclease